MSKFSKYVGKPYGNTHYGCFLLAASIYHNEYGLFLPTPPNSNDNRYVYSFYEHCLKYMQKIKHPKEGDIVLLHTIPWHVGIVTDPLLHKMIHVQIDTGGAVIERYDNARWKHRVEGVYRHRSLLEHVEKEQYYGNKAF